MHRQRLVQQQLATQQSQLLVVDSSERIVSWYPGENKCRRGSSYSSVFLLINRITDVI